MTRSKVSTPDLSGFQLVPARRGSSLTVRALEATGRTVFGLAWGTGRLAWRNRWHLAPVAGVLTCTAGDPLTVGAACTTTAIVAGLAARSGKPFAGRMWLSARERWTAAHWAALAAGWACTTPLYPGHVQAGAALAAATAWPTWRWWAGRSPKLGRFGGKTGRAYTGEWAPVAESLQVLHGSHVLQSTLQLLDGDGATFRVQLDGAHAEDAATSAVRRHVEARLRPHGKRLGTGTVTVALVRDDASVIEVTVAPQRLLELQPVPWTGAAANPDGSVTCTTAVNGRRHAIHTRNKDGIEFLLFIGGSGTGKSTTATVVLLPGIKARQEVLWVIDGGEGSSLPDLHPVIDWPAYDQAQARRCIRAAHAVLVARKKRRAAAGKKRFRVGQEDDPVLRVHVEEAPAVLPWLTATEVGMVLDIINQGRKLGVAFSQSAQDAIAQFLIGGALARQLMPTNGTVIGHRVSDQLSSNRATGATSELPDLRALPGEPGFVRVIHRGQTSPVLRVDLPDDDLLAAEVASIGEPRRLEGADLEAARSAGYDERFADATQEATEPGDLPTVEDKADPRARDKVLAVLENQAYEHRAGDADSPGVAPRDITVRAEVSPRSTYLALRELAALDPPRAVKLDRGVWAAWGPVETVVGEGALIVAAPETKM